MLQDRGKGFGIFLSFLFPVVFPKGVVNAPGLSSHQLSLVNAFNDAVEEKQKPS